MEEMRFEMAMRSVLGDKVVYHCAGEALGIQEGSTAQRLWMEAVLDGKRDDQKEKILSDLVEYCGLDTLAMVKIFNVLGNIVH